EGCLHALKLALVKLGSGHSLIHHSDRGMQYCSGEYIGLLKSRKIAISMTEKRSPHQNAIAERINGILKHELDLKDTFMDINEASKQVDKAIEIYNDFRPHASCNYLTPNQAYQQEGVLIKRWSSN
ncbi:MAG: integrase core domain-containing protein, partial [Bacteroidota bacterium]